jgi:hypothetical protein
MHFVWYPAVSAKRSPPIATDWSGFTNYNLLKETRLSWYQSIDKTYFGVYGKSDGRLSIPFTKKLESKKNGT